MLEILSIPVAIDVFDVGVDQASGDRSGHGAVTYLRAVDAADGANAETGRRNEDLFRVQRIVKVDIRFLDTQLLFPREIDCRLAADARQDVAFSGCQKRAVLHDEYVATLSFGQVAVCVEQYGMRFGVPVLYFQIREDEIEIVVCLGPRAQRIR